MHTYFSTTGNNFVYMIIEFTKIKMFTEGADNGIMSSFDEISLSCRLFRR